MILLFVLLAAFVLVPVIYEVTQDKTEANRKRANLIAMMEELNRLDLENEQYRRYLDGENFDEYLERHARDEWGYADPHERIYRAN
ncbi:MAG: hypothetical protein FWG83_01480 [Oscillospiraceae bacterium]|nr:hypothetical protein [Oscillospiraceae bacterium]